VVLFGYSRNPCPSTPIPKDMILKIEYRYPRPLPCRSNGGWRITRGGVPLDVENAWARTFRCGSDVAA
jgi:hypothetical protein